MLENSGRIKWNLMLRKYLRSHGDAREKYASIKLDLVQKNSNGFHKNKIQLRKKK